MIAAGGSYRLACASPVLYAKSAPCKNRVIALSFRRQLRLACRLLPSVQLRVNHLLVMAGGVAFTVMRTGAVACARESATDTNR